VSEVWVWCAVCACFDVVWQRQDGLTVSLFYDEWLLKAWLCCYVAADDKWIWLMQQPRHSASVGLRGVRCVGKWRQSSYIRRQRRDKYEAEFGSSRMGCWCDIAERVLYLWCMCTLLRLVVRCRRRPRVGDRKLANLLAGSVARVVPGPV